jgi:hypothetical protein
MIISYLTTQVVVLPFHSIVEMVKINDYNKLDPQMRMLSSCLLMLIGKKHGMKGLSHFWKNTKVSKEFFRKAIEQHI